MDTAGDLYTVDINAISLPSNERFKRILDITTAAILIVLSPVLVFFGRGITIMLRNTIKVLIGKRTWVGYISKSVKGLPNIKQGVFPPIKLSSAKALNDSQVERLNMLYAKNYNISKDIKAIWTNIT